MERWINPTVLLITLAIVLLSGRAVSNQSSDSEWIDLFNGKDLDDWTVKIRGSEAGVNYKNTYRVEDGILKVSYDEYEKFSGEFGNLFYNPPCKRKAIRSNFAKSN